MNPEKSRKRLPTRLRTWYASSVLVQASSGSVQVQKRLNHRNQRYNSQTTSLRTQGTIGVSF